MSYASDRAHADCFIPAVKRIVGPYLLEPAPLEVDCAEATDLIVLRARDMRIAVRIRRPGYADDYPFQFTIRARRDNGIKTELAKIVEGFGDWFFYGHADPAGNAINLWWLIDLYSFRAALIRNGQNGAKLATGDKPNGDGTWFKWFDLRSFGPNPPILIAGSRDLPKWTASNSNQLAAAVVKPRPGNRSTSAPMDQPDLFGGLPFARKPSRG